MESENPFAAPSNVEKAIPAVPVDLENNKLDDKESLVSIAKRTFLAWEKLRILYVGILVAFTIGTVFLGSHRTNFGSPDLWLAICFGAIAANMCYFLGPIIETYTSWLGVPYKPVRIAVFACGTLFAGLLAVVSILLL